MAEELAQGSTPGGEGLDVLLEAAKPDLYRLNAFRITELPVDAGTRDISRRWQMVEMSRETGLPIPPGPGRALPLDNSSDPEILAQAMQRLRDPERRLVDEFFWFWPHILGQSGNDQALAALAQGETAAASRIWEEQELAYSEANVSMHNLAVLAHAKALDMEQANSQRDLSAAKKKERTQWWQRAFERWQILLDHEGFWSRLTARIRDLDDQRLTNGTARRLRATLPLALLSINGQLAVQAAEAESVAEARRHRRIMQGSGFESSVIDQAMQRTVQPMRQRIKALCQNSEADADADPQHADTVTRRFLDQAKALLGILDSLLPAKHATRQAMHDEVALTALRCAIPYSNKTEDWEMSLDLLQRTLPIAAGRAARERIEESIRTVEGNRQLGTCWFCGQERSDEEAAVEVKMYGNVQRTPIVAFDDYAEQLQWQQATVPVPRCAGCKAAHNRLVISSCIGLFVGASVGLAASIFLFEAGVFSYFGSFMTFLAFVSVGLIILAQIGGLPDGTKPEETKLEFPGIAALQEDGWQVGEKPPEAN